MAKKGGLGRGLDSLFSENATDEKTTIEIRLSEIEPNKDQPRKDFDEEALAELADSIMRHGLIQPLLVRPMTGGGYQIVAGERRWRACRMAGLLSVPVIVREMDDTEAMEIALIENLQREDLNPVEEAMGYKSLIEEFGMTQEEASIRVGKSRPAVTNALRLLSLPDDALSLVRNGEISAGHGRALLSFEDMGVRSEALELAKNGASVRELERLSKGVKTRKASERGQLKIKTPKDVYFGEVELALSSALGRKVSVEDGKDKAKLCIEFYGKEDLEGLIKQLSDLKKI